MTEVPGPKRCTCGAIVRFVIHGSTPVKVDDEPVLGGDLMINVDRIVARLAPSTAGLAGRNGHLGFRFHHCDGRRR